MMLKAEITSPEGLLAALQKCEGNAYKRLFTQLSLNAEDFAPYCFWRKETYARNCIFRNESFELILLCWESGHATPIHCHNDQECWVYVLDGEVEEKRYQLKENEMVEEQHVRSERTRLSYMQDSMGYHKLKNNGTERAMTLHLYVKPIDECQVWDEKQKQFEIKTLKYHSYQGELL